MGAGVTAAEIAEGGVGRARRALYLGLRPLLASEGDDRVQPYDDGIPPVPGITIGKPRLSRRSVGDADVTTATFPVVIRVDGSKRAQLIKLDELIDKVWKAGNGLGRLSRSVSSSPSTTDAVGSGTSSTQTQTVDVEIGVDPITWCPSVPESEES